MKKWLFLSGLLLLLSCNRGGSVLSSRPSGVLSKDEMVDMIVDITLAESALRVGNIQHTLPADSTYQKVQFAEVFKKRGVSPDDFNRSLTYYIERIDQLNDIYNEVIKQLILMDTELQGPGAKPAADSSSNKKYILGTKPQNPQ